MCHISCTWGQGRMFRKHWLYFYSLPVKGLHKQNQWLPVTIRHFPPWESNGQVNLDWSERETIGRQRGKDGTTDNRQLEGKGRKMKDPRSWWGDLCSHGLICPLIPHCVDRWVQATLHCGFARRCLRPTVDQPCQASAVGLGGPASLPGVPLYKQRTMCTAHGPWQNGIVWTWLTGLMGLSKSAKQTAVKLNTWALAYHNNFRCS